MDRRRTTNARLASRDSAMRVASCAGCLLLLALVAGSRYAGAQAPAGPAPGTSPGVAPGRSSGAAPGAAPVAPPAAGSAAERPADVTLRAIESEGQRIASYHEAMAKARERSRDRDPSLSDESRMVAVTRSGTWHVVFLRQLTTAGVNKGLMAFADAVFQPRVGDISAFQVFDPPKPSPSDAQAAIRAGDAAKARVLQGMPSGVSFDEALFRDGQGPWTVILQRRADVSGTANIGGDFSVTVSPDGQQVTDSKPIHDPSVGATVALAKSGAPTLHVHPVGDLPTPTDVALVIEHPALVPHLVLTPRWMFRIESGGTITFLGPNAVPPVAPGGSH